MEIGVDSFAAQFDERANANLNGQDAMSQLLERIVYADKMGLDVFGIGEHHRREFLASAPTTILAARTTRIRLTSSPTLKQPPAPAADNIQSGQQICPIALF
jgi:alkanesulfonate monooxygenase SsuD/methylene tetrahydromethanopterin reductase-like flavin-dependent oxidoreductase (luciferase family)